MPLSTPKSRREVHYRVLDMKTFARDDGLFDVEGHLVDCKPFVTERSGNSEPVAAGQPRHDMWVRLTVDNTFVVRDVEAVSDTTPFGVCKEAAPSLAAVIGMSISSGWSIRVKERLRGTASCTHLMEVLIPLGSTAYQAINALRTDRITNLESQVNKIDSCYAYGREREVVQRLWPARIKSMEKP